MLKIIKKVNLDDSKLNKMPILACVKERVFDAPVDLEGHADFQLMNLDGSLCAGEDIAILIEQRDFQINASDKADIEEYTKDLILKYQMLKIDPDRLKVGVWRFNDYSEVTIVMAVAIPREHIKQIFRFSGWAGHEFIYDIEADLLAPSGTNLWGPKKLSTQDIAKSVSALLVGKLPDFIPEQTDEEWELQRSACQLRYRYIYGTAMNG